jgi:hypothetical protein
MNIVHHGGGWGSDGTYWFRANARGWVPVGTVTPQGVGALPQGVGGCCADCDANPTRMPCKGGCGAAKPALGPYTGATPPQGTGQASDGSDGSTTTATTPAASPTTTTVTTTTSTTPWGTIALVAIVAVAAGAGLAHVVASHEHKTHAMARRRRRRA